MKFSSHPSPAKKNVKAEMKISISKQELASLPTAHFKGKITVIDDSEAVAEAVERLSASDLIGFDTETRPTFKKGQNHQVALMQLSSETECFLFRLNRIGLPEALKFLLEDPEKKKIGLSLHDDFRNLKKNFDLEPKGFVELQQYVEQWGIADKSLSKMYGILFGERISKGQRLSNWEADHLAESQQHYAALDAFACIRIYRELSEGKFNPDSSIYRIEEHEEI